MATFLASDTFVWMEMKFSLQSHWTSWFASDYFKLLSYKDIAVSFLYCESVKIQVLLEWNLFLLINQEVTALFDFNFFLCLCLLCDWKGCSFRRDFVRTWNMCWTPYPINSYCEYIKNDWCKIPNIPKKYFLSNVTIPTLLTPFL